MAQHNTSSETGYGRRDMNRTGSVGEGWDGNTGLPGEGTHVYANISVSNRDYQPLRRLACMVRLLMAGSSWGFPLWIYSEWAGVMIHGAWLLKRAEEEAGKGGNTLIFTI